MTDAVDTTQWSRQGPADMPRDELQIQLEVYKETILLRGFENDATWVRTVSADAIANVFTQHLGSSSGLLPQEALWWGQGETGQVVALWRPPQVWSVALQREAFKPPPGSGCRCRGWSSSARRAARPGSTPQLSRPTDPEQHLFRAPAFNVFRDGRVCPGSHRFPEEVGLIPESFFQSFFSLTGDSPGPLEEAPRQPASRYGRSSMERLRTRLRTWFPSARWARRWRSPRGDVATASPAPGPVGYLVNHPGGLAGVQGIGYDYVLGSGGVYVQSQSAHLTARVLVAPGTVRGLAPVAEKVQLTHGPIPAQLFELGLRWFQDAPDTERLFAVRWDGDGYRLVVPQQAGTATRLAYQPPAGVVAEFHSHGSSRAFFSATDDRDEQGFRIYGVVGRLDAFHYRS